eukprot:53015-Chlamydomonas_euryale.AAC.1
MSGRGARPRWRWGSSGRGARPRWRWGSSGRGAAGRLSHDEDIASLLGSVASTKRWRAPTAGSGQNFVPAELQKRMPPA